MKNMLGTSSQKRLIPNKSAFVCKPSFDECKIINNTFFDNIDLAPWESEANNNNNLNALLEISENSPEKRKNFV